MTQRLLQSLVLVYDSESKRGHRTRQLLGHACGRHQHGGFFIAVSPILRNQGVSVSIPATCFAAAFETAGRLNCGNQDETLTVSDLDRQTVKLADLPFFPLGMAIDNAHGLIYISGGTANKIAVYNTKGVVLTTIE
jgi:hypothetical protein